LDKEDQQKGQISKPPRFPAEEHLQYYQRNKINVR